MCTAVRKFFFFLDPLRTGKVKIQDILACSFLDDLLEVGLIYFCQKCLNIYIIDNYNNMAFILGNKTVVLYYIDLFQSLYKNTLIFKYQLSKLLLQTINLYRMMMIIIKDNNKINITKVVIASYVTSSVAQPPGKPLILHYSIQSL